MVRVGVACGAACELFVAVPSRDREAVCAPIPAGWQDEGGQRGIDVYSAIVAAADRGVKIRIVVVRTDCLHRCTFSIQCIFHRCAVQDAVTADDSQRDVLSLIAMGAAEGLFLDFTKIGKSEGVLHTKFAVADSSGALPAAYSRFLMSTWCKMMHTSI